MLIKAAVCIEYALLQWRRKKMDKILSSTERFRLEDNDKWFNKVKDKEWTLDKAIEFIQRYGEYTRGYPGDFVTDEEAYYLHCAKNYIANELSLGKIKILPIKDYERVKQWIKEE